jgi:hypothetical protein
MLRLREEPIEGKEDTWRRIGVMGIGKGYCFFSYGAKPMRY